MRLKNNIAVGLATTSLLLLLSILSVTSAWDIRQQTELFHKILDQYPDVNSKERNELRRRLQEGGPPPFAAEIGIVLAGLPPLTAELFTLETPITVRFTGLYSAMWWNCCAVYSTEYKDALTKTKPIITVPENIQSHTTINRAVCGAQAAASLSALSLPGALGPFVDAMSTLPNDAANVEVGMNPDVLACPSLDATCLGDIAANAGYTPFIMGHIVAKLAYDYSIVDGYNQFGTDNGCTVNCRAYRDTTGYVPNPNNDDEQYDPLLEDDRKGFFFHQQHVVPHIGYTGKFRAISESERETRVAPIPNYTSTRYTEALSVIETMSKLDDIKKMQVEVFDDKLTVAISVINSFVGKTLMSGYQDQQLGQPGLILSYERLIHFVTTHDFAEFDAVIIAWRNKRRYNLVRPTTIIKRWGPNQMITTWSNTGSTNTTFPASDFEAYKRVMPHSEYVSGSACIFQAVEEVVTDYLTHIGLETSFFPVTFEIPAGSSTVEPGVVPANDIVLSYPNITVMAQVGSQSRIDGGMHFGTAVPGAKQVCTGIGSTAVSVTTQLYPTSPPLTDEV